VAPLGEMRFNERAGAELTVDGRGPGELFQLSSFFLQMKALSLQLGLQGSRFRRGD
jgi:hypothetical protein